MLRRSRAAAAWRRPSFRAAEQHQVRPPAALLIALVVAGASLMVLDRTGGDDSPVASARAVVGEVVGPLESGAARVADPIAAVPGWFRSRATLREDVDALRAENSQLRARLATSDLDEQRLASYDALTATARERELTLVPARVVAHGPAQSFSRTVTIDAGTDAGVHADMTVLNADGLVGRVLHATSSSATVLLIADTDSTVGARIGGSGEVGSLTGRGHLGSEARVDLELVDRSVTPSEGDTVVTWGSAAGGPYRAGIPVGTVERVFSTPRDTSLRAVIDPFVDFTTLDVIGVVVDPDTAGDRAVISPDGSIG